MPNDSISPTIIYLPIVSNSTGNIKILLSAPTQESPDSQSTLFVFVIPNPNQLLDKFEDSDNTLGDTPSSKKNNNE